MKKLIELKILGMSCNHCVMTIKNALSEKFGIKSVKVDLDKKEAQIKASNDVTPNSLISIVEELGYEAAVK